MSEAQIERKSQSMTQSKMDYPHLHSPLSTTCYDVFIHIDWIVLIKCTLSKCHPGGNLDNQKEACRHHQSYLLLAVLVSRALWLCDSHPKQALVKYPS